MKKTINIWSDRVLLSLQMMIALFVVSCDKDNEVPIATIEINDMVVPTATSASIMAEYKVNKNATIKTVRFYYGLDSTMKDCLQLSVPVDNASNSVTFFVNSLISLTRYYYCYEFVNPINARKSEIKSFYTTDCALPSITTNAISNITINSASCGGNVISDGETPITARGVCWSTSQNPTIANSHTSNGSGTGSFTSSIPGLSLGTTYYVRAYATNNKGTNYGAQRTFTTLNGVAVVTTNAVSNIRGITAVCGGNVTSTGGLNVTAKGVCWSTSSNPTIANTHTSNGSGTGSFSSSMTGLTLGTTYYVRAYAKNSHGTSYGAQKTFTTLNGVAVVTTNAVSNITATTATCGGNVTSDGGLNVTARGVCWSTSQNPTVYNSHTTNSSGTGSFTSSITGLTLGTTYYVRAYASNSHGTRYGAQRSFTTSNSATTVQALTVSATQNGSDYSSTGFEHNGSYYTYEFDWESIFSYSNTQYADTIGFYLNGWQYYYTSVSDGTHTNYWTSWSNTSSTTVTYQAYAVKTDGTYVYGQEKSIYLYYGGKNSTTQKVEFDIDVNKMSKNRVVTAKSTSNMNEIRTK